MYKVTKTRVLYLPQTGSQYPGINLLRVYMYLSFCAINETDM